MKKTAKKNADAMRAEYDFSKAKRGTHADRYAAGHEVVLLKPKALKAAKQRKQMSTTSRSA